MLSGLVDLPASGIQIAISPNGRPVLACGVPWDFSISHSGDLAACAVADLPIGVDLERATLGRSLLGLAREHFHAPEVEDVVALLSAGNEQEAAARFYAYWTLKEAHLKRRGGSVWDMKEAPAFPLEAGPGPVASGDASWWWCLRTRPQGSSPCAYVISLSAGGRGALEGCLNRPELHLMYLLAEEPEPCLLFRSAIAEQPEGRAGTR
jgi:phosphopantetheinyl transferase